MERLPDLLVLDFCEWLKQSLLRRTKYNDVDMWDLLFDDRYADILIKKAEEYCQRQKKAFRGLEQYRRERYAYRSDECIL